MMHLGKCGLKMRNLLKDFYKDKTVLVTGSTGFKGVWLTKILQKFGANVIGYSLENESTKELYNLSGIVNSTKVINGDVRDFEKLYKIFKENKPEIVFHLAAQPLVIESYKNPILTYETNVMGTVNLLECIRQTDSVKSVINITTDKVYQNNEWEWGYRENDRLNGFDPYSNSKSCSELITESYIKSFFYNSNVSISTARAGNVIGGGDFSENRIIPDCIRNSLDKKSIIIRNPLSIRPYQHVLDPLYAYLLIAMKQHENKENASTYNVGPEDKDCVTTKHLVDMFCNEWGDDATWESRESDGPHEANFLKLDCSKIKTKLGWYPQFTIKEAVELTVEWTMAYKNKKDISKVMEKQINLIFD